MGLFEEDSRVYKAKKILKSSIKSEPKKKEKKTEPKKSKASSKNSLVESASTSNGHIDLEDIDLSQQKAKKPQQEKGLIIPLINYVSDE